MRRAIRTHRADFTADRRADRRRAIAVSAYILEHQPSFVFGQSYYTVARRSPTAAAVTAGQGQAVTIAGVQVGQVGGVSLQRRPGRREMNIYKKYAPIYRNATVLLRPRTPLKDMYLALDPGTPQRRARCPPAATLSAANTQPDVDVSEILSSLDADTRNYLLLLLSGGAQAFHDHGSAPATAPERRGGGRPAGHAQALRAAGPRHQAVRRAAGHAPGNLRRAIHNLNLVASSLGGVDGELASLIDASDTNFSAISAQDASSQQTLTAVPADAAPDHRRSARSAASPPPARPR